jgi:hypothetical protein
MGELSGRRGLSIKQMMNKAIAEGDYDLHAASPNFHEQEQHHYTGE